MNTATITLDEVLAFVRDARGARLTAIIEEAERVREQTKTLLALGDEVRIDNIRPAALKGLTGKVSGYPKNGNSKRFAVTLDATSTQILRRARFTSRSVPFVPDDVEEYEVTGLPASCLFPV